MAATSIKDSLMNMIRRKAQSENHDIALVASVITSDAILNKKKLIAALESVNFTDSAIPRDILEMRSTEGQDCGDIEYAVLSVIGQLQADTMGFDVDITEIDRKLYMMAVMLESSVRLGEVETAFAAKAGLMNGVFRIRNQLHRVDERLRDAYLAECEEYLDNYYLYISVKNMIDRQSLNIRRSRAGLEKERAMLESAKNDLALMLQTDPLLMDEVGNAWQQSYENNSAFWTQNMHDLYNTLVQMRITESGLLFKGYILQTQEKQMFSYKEIGGKLEDIVRIVPVPEDPSLVNTLQDIVTGTIEQGIKVDEELVMISGMMSELQARAVQRQNNDINSQELKMAGQTFDVLEKKIYGQDEEEDPIGDDLFDFLKY